MIYKLFHIIIYSLILNEIDNRNVLCTKTTFISTWMIKCGKVFVAIVIPSSQSETHLNTDKHDHKNAHNPK